MAAFRRHRKRWRRSPRPSLTRFARAATNYNDYQQTIIDVATRDKTISDLQAQVEALKQELANQPTQPAPGHPESPAPNDTPSPAYPRQFEGSRDLSGRSRHAERAHSLPAKDHPTDQRDCLWQHMVGLVLRPATSPGDSFSSGSAGRASDLREIVRRKRSGSGTRGACSRSQWDAFS